MIKVPDWLWDNAPWIVGGTMVILVIAGVFWISLDVGSARAYCADLGMLYNPDFHGCVEGVNIP